MGGTVRWKKLKSGLQINTHCPLPTAKRSENGHPRGTLQAGSLAGRPQGTDVQGQGKR